VGGKPTDGLGKETGHGRSEEELQKTNDKEQSAGNNREALIA